MAETAASGRTVQNGLSAWPFSAGSNVPSFKSEYKKNQYLSCVTRFECVLCYRVYDFARFPEVLRCIRNGTVLSELLQRKEPCDMRWFDGAIGLSLHMTLAMGVVPA